MKQSTVLKLNLGEGEMDKQDDVMSLQSTEMSKRKTGFCKPFSLN